MTEEQGVELIGKVSDLVDKLDEFFVYQQQLGSGLVVILGLIMLALYALLLRGRK